MIYTNYNITKLFQKIKFILLFYFIIIIQKLLFKINIFIF